ncbi:hypothetical protein A9P79_25665 [Cupriavidus taiwanensis]|uniref:hypothetical protein n=1 Tax=Cupriavidus taiwanensis TaxID=164546 RepID=UPI001EFFEF07|nr:hypothetical protein [Cupriavidus taiwanensis]ULX55227.1 hypothetical protein A9P79_25665 [Cupriavidus taiwanensis]
MTDFERLEASWQAFQRAAYLLQRANMVEAEALVSKYAGAAFFRMGLVLRERGAEIDADLAAALPDMMAAW